MKDNVTVCDVCENEFVIELHVKEYAEGVEETYFRCTHCGEKYTGVVTDPEIRKQQRVIKKMLDKVAKARSTAESKKQFAQIKLAKRSLNKKMKKLRKRFEKSKHLHND